MSRRLKRKELIDQHVVGGLFEIFDDMKQQGYEERIGQTDMALDIAEAIRDQEHIVIEAGVGIGKSFAYLFPSMLYKKLTERPVIIASSTIHLTEQLNEDIKDVETITNQKITSIVGKGQKNYYCEKRALKYATKSNKNNRINRYISDYPNSSIKLTSSEWNELNVKKCTFVQCIHRFNCEFYNMRQGLNGYGKMAGDLIVVNQDLLIASFLKEEKTGRPLIDNRSEIIIIDEAHNLEDKARNALTISYRKKDAINLIVQAENIIGISYKETKNNLNQMYKDVYRHVKSNQPEDFEHSRAFFIEDYLKKYEKIVLNLQDIYNKVQVIDMQKGNISDELIEELDKFVGLIKGIFKSESSNSIYWAEINNSQLSICSAPNDISRKLNSLFFNNSKLFVLTSATISAGIEDVKYKYFRDSIGLKNAVVSPSKPSPFSYDSNARLFLPTEISKYDSPEYIDQLSDHIIKIATVTSGRTLVLFTSKKEMTSVYELLSKSQSNFNVLIQSNKSEKETLKEFRNSKGILLATGTYWEGLNIKGSDLTSLIIARLPFPVPDPIIENKMNNSSNRYTDVLLPEMIIKLKQGVGRLIRTASDVGLLSILDYRLSKNSKYKYKEKILKSIPIQNRVYSIEEINNFFESKQVSKIN